MARYDEVLRTRIEPSLKKGFQRLSKKWKASMSDVARALVYLEIREKMPDLEIEFDVDELPHQLALYVKSRLEKLEKKKSKAA